MTENDAPAPPTNVDPPPPPPPPPVSVSVTIAAGAGTEYGAPEVSATLWPLPHTVSAAVHTDGAVAPTVDENVPAGHAVQAAGAGARELYVPAAQGAHTEPAAYAPAPQAVHTAGVAAPAADAAAYVPAVQAVHAVAPKFEE